MCFPKNFAEVLFKNTYDLATSETSKNENSSTGEISSTDEEILRKKNNINMVSNRSELNV